MLDENDLRNLQNLDSTYLREEFLKELNVLKNKIHRDCRQKHLNGVGMNMPMFLVFLEKFVNAFNEGKLPSISSAYAALIENEIYEHTESAKETFRMGLAGAFGKSGPMQASELYFKINRLRDGAFEILNNCFMIGERNEEVFERYKLELIEFMDKEEQRLFEKNKELSRNANQGILYTQMHSFLESLDDVFDNETNESEDMIKQVVPKLENEFLKGYLDQKVGVNEEQPFSEQIKVFSFQLLMRFKQNARRLETRKKNIQFREDQQEKNLFERKKLELELAEKTFNRNKQDYEDLQEQIQRINEGGRNEQEIINYREEIQSLRRKIKDKEGEFENNKKAIMNLEMELQELRKKKKKRGCF